LETVINKLDEQIWTISEQTQKHAFSGGSGTEKMWDITKDELRNNPFLWFELIHHEDKHKYQLDKNVYKFHLGERLIRIIHNDGSIKQIKYKSFRTYDKNNKPILYGITSNITKYLETKKIITLMEESIYSMKQAFCILRPSTSELQFHR